MHQMAEKNTRLQLRCSADFIDLIDDWRATKRPLPSQSEAVRKLVIRGVAIDECLETILRKSIARLAEKGMLKVEDYPEIYDYFQELIVSSLDETVHIASKSSGTVHSAREARPTTTAKKPLLYKNTHKKRSNAH